MFNSINKIFSKYTGLLIRMDDICENMNWELMNRCELLFDKYEIKPSDKNDIFNYGGDSEFYGLDYSKQFDKIEMGLSEFKKREIKVRSFFAPNHIYDQNTLEALKKKNIKIIIDGYGLFPFYKSGLLFIPQLFYKEIFLPFGIQATQLHINYWSNKDFKRFEDFIMRYHKKIINLDYIINITNPNLFQNITNYVIEKTLKTARFFSIT